MTASEPSPFRVPPFVHRVGGWIERHPGLWTRLGELETRFADDRLDGAEVDRPVYVSGLARSGSTILLELLSGSPEVATHRYRDFPAIHVPLMWNWFLDRAASGEQEAAQRAHLDGIMVTPESPEAFEEVLWMAFFDHLHDPAADAVLDAETSHPRFERFYRDHIRKLCLLRKGSRYLAKNNYDTTRLGYLLKLFPDARFVLPIRQPESHIASLIKQHNLFVQAQRSDRQVLDHFRRAGHFEFGLGRQPVGIAARGGAGNALACWQAGREVAGWAYCWDAIYGFVADQLEASPELRAATIVVRYEDLCREPAGMMGAILDHCGLAPGGMIEAARRRIRYPDYYVPRFAGADIDDIRAITATTAGRFGYEPS